MTVNRCSIALKLSPLPYVNQSGSLQNNIRNHDAEWRVGVTSLTHILSIYFPKIFIKETGLGMLVKLPVGKSGVLSASNNAWFRAGIMKYITRYSWFYNWFFIFTTNSESFCTSHLELAATFILIARWSRKSMKNTAGVIK